jgi:hypothetical protein
MLAFLPSLCFFLLAPVSVSLALWFAFAVAFTIGIRAFGHTRTLRIFDAAGLALFGGLAIYAGFVDTDLGPCSTALALETGLCGTILWSMAVRRPVTVQYRWLHRPAAPELAARAHLLLTSVWATAYAAMAAASAGAVVLHKMPPVWAGILGLLIFASALTFTWQFGVYIDRRAAAPGNKEST